MSQETLYFLETTGSGSNPNFANAEGSTQFFSYSHSATNSLTSGLLNALVKGGVAKAISNANVTFSADPTFASLFTETSGTGEAGVYFAESQSQTQVIATFEIDANQTFSFDFDADINLSAKEIESSAEANQANSKASFIVLETSQFLQPEVIDYFGISGELISGQGVGDVAFGGSDSVSFDTDQFIDLDGDNGIDSIDANAFTGTYERTFENSTRLTLVKLTSSQIELSGDALVQELGSDVITGGVGNDQLNGTSNADQFYSSIGNDIIHGFDGNDILEGGDGDDKLFGDGGNDALHGSFGSDTLDGGSGQDTLVGGSGHDQFKFEVSQGSFSGGDDDDDDDDSGYWGGGDDDDDDDNGNDGLIEPSGYDRIKDFEVGIDEIVLEGMGSMNSATGLNQLINQGRIYSSGSNTVIELHPGGQVVLEDVNWVNLSSDDFQFV